MTWIDAGILITILLGIYFIPFIVALINDHKQLSAIFVLNLFAGWTFLGWVGALIWAVLKQGEDNGKRIN